MDSQIVTLLVLIVVSAALAVSGWLRRPGIGIIAALLLIAGLVWLRPGGLEQLGFGGQESWLITLLVGFLLGVGMALLALAVIEPAAERITGKAHDLSIVDGLRGNPLALVQWLLLVWVVVAFAEEIIFRGYMMGELATLLGDSLLAAGANLLLTSLVFGIAHAYQGPSGAISATLVGGLIGAVFLVAGFNLWLVILVHGFIDTVQLILIAAGLDGRIRQSLIKPRA